ncbi:MULTISPECIES: nucleoside phosphorylase [Sphingobacterium]|jgi:uridine phosphorylase|uniref:nucleoside phosphorylase n=1 Tax=Sphingobacterium TaxID=28453 RepID=UPI000E03B0B0|nr:MULTISPECIES: nucleoside phosphorylase [Sphingobacterium]HAE66742.1 phosphorylase [Sphingobacterium sp.]QQT47283.1 nucleoside phosphorylase [Sphingobacterium multivorum]SUJ04392.1 Uridine phosphorylase [Sphingobacterium multivorum]HAU53666.1 phosphorylase [Sphingobacterium sp.]HCX56854.1 phosphorylase [Sphingobacterium sp.]
MINASELILNADGSIYHLNLLPEDLASTVITVGDPDRVAKVSKYFDRIELKKGKREFITHTGYLGNKRLTVISTGIGTDNIDIVLNELDALANIDFANRTVKSTLSSLHIVRIGTSGAVQQDVEMGTILASAYGVGLDALMNYYRGSYDGEEQALQVELAKYFSALNLNPYVAKAGAGLLDRIAFDLPKGVTLTAPGFYAPQGRTVRSTNTIPNFIDLINSFQYKGQRFTNLEMETAGIYALANMFGHQALSINAILASRVDGRFSSAPEEVVDKAIQLVLERI